MSERSFWKGRRVLVTGHSGFKGGWMATWLTHLGSCVAGFALPPNTEPAFFHLCHLADRLESKLGDIRDFAAVEGAARSHQPEIIFHFAAQPLVRLSYEQPVETFATNIMGIVNVLEAAKTTPSVRAVVVVTSDKCYENRGWVWGYRENEAMGGRDPYSASKGCAELVAASYQHSFFRTANATVATVRAGNVIGGGDWSADRLVPDAARAFASSKPLAVRNPSSVRPWQHVLDPLYGYLMLAEKIVSEQRRWEGGWNFGPSEAGAISVAALADMIVQSWSQGTSWERVDQVSPPHEEAYLKLDSSKARQILGWRPRLRVREAVEWTVAWYKLALESGDKADLFGFTVSQISRYQERVAHAEE